MIATPGSFEHPMNLRDLVHQIRPLDVAGSLDVDIDAVVSDSRDAGRGSLFVAIRGGQQRDRHQFVADAVARGAGAVVVEEHHADTGAATRIVVDDCRAALAALAASLHGHPARAFRWCVGVTGTNGKSTTAVLVRHVLEAAGAPCGYIGTLGFACAGQQEPLPNTTPEAGHLQALLARARDAGCQAMAMEVSSHGLALGRVAGIDFSAAVFTNLSRDHLDFHGTEEDYAAAKSRLFEGLGESAAAVLNADDPLAQRIAQRTAARVLTFGETGEHVRLLDARRHQGRTHLHLQTPAGRWEVDTSLTGRFNSSNVMAAAAVGVALGIDAGAVSAGIASVSQVPGRFERIDAGQPFEVIVDYAHTPAGLETVLRTARELTKRRLLCVFGCGGDRDKGKRPLMGRVAEELADVVILTSDNPRTESPQQIIDQIAAGMQHPGRAAVVADRRQAIASALTQAAEGDVVVLAGKGDEPYQILAEGRVPFDDRQVARQVLRG